ncbi:MAG: response regulator [Elainella sp. Prado103]|jgi:DNA-binding response OmpR family regulator/HPt (histidine-containing phosphotransfer) domain-containing protein|nr:response regulator [Elainella sp. Prado103]
MRILLIEDDERIVEVVTAILTEQNYVIDVAEDGEAGWELIESFPYDLVLLDIVLPRLDGITLCRRLRSQKKQVLVMLLTARDTTTDKLLGLDAGADDYVVKPFDPRELAARIRALLRRGSMVTTSVLTCGALQLDPSSCEVTYNGQLLRFSRKEYLLLELFLRHQNRVFSRGAIVDQIWSFNEDPPNEDTVKSHIKSIRRKLDAVGAGDLIETLYGQGYRINPSHAEARSPDPATQQQTLEISVAAIWQRTRQTSLKQVQLLSQMVQALQTMTLELELQQQASRAAHKLAGSLGTFGLDEGSHLAQQIELLLPTDGILLPEMQQQLAAQVAPLVDALEQMVVAPRSLLPIPQSSPTSSPIPAQSQNTTVAALSLGSPSPFLLLLDRDRDFSRSFAAQSKDYGVRLKIASTATAARKHCHQERPDAAILDFSTLQADPNSAILLTDLQADPSVPIVFLANQAGTQDRIEAVRAGGQQFLQKPLAPVTVLQTVANLLARQKTASFQVLVVDDDPTIALILRDCLEPNGMVVTGLTQADQFWDVLNALQPDLLILDINMPKIDGLDLCQTIRHDAQWSWIPIVVLTAQTDRQTQQRAFLAGADDLMHKPIEMTEVAIRIKRRLERSRFYRQVSSHIQPKP